MRKNTKPAQFHIREAVEQDFDALCKIFAEGVLLHHTALPDVFRKPDGAVIDKERVCDLIASEDAALLAAERDGEPIGFVCVLAQDAGDISIMLVRRFAFVENLAVTERFRRSGVGRALMEAAHRWALSRGLARIELNVWEFNQDAIAFYEKLGYETASRKMWKKLG
ncbi:MAG TPA: GNAT family N-acetyltransferase [Armatimonadota bacterium]|nr:GNAT family N-acetyltransferase [Armatimonadota bacterium]